MISTLLQLLQQEAVVCPAKAGVFNRRKGTERSGDSMTKPLKRAVNKFLGRNETAYDERE